MTYLQYLLLGLGSGAVIAALALGVLLDLPGLGRRQLRPRRAGHVPRLHLRRACASAASCSIPIVGLPGRVQIFPSDVKPTWATAFAITMVIGRAARPGRLLAGVPSAARGARRWPRWSPASACSSTCSASPTSAWAARGRRWPSPRPILPSSVVEVLGVQIPADRLWLLGLVVGDDRGAGRGVPLHPLRPGHPGRGREREGRGAARPLPRCAWPPINWMIASMLAGAAVILIAPIAGLDPGTTSLLIVPALAAALLGGFRSFALTTAAGLGIGMLQSRDPQPARRAAAGSPSSTGRPRCPLVIIVVIMAVRGERIPSRGTLREGRFPRVADAPPPGLVGRRWLGAGARSGCSPSTARGARASSCRW